MPAASAAPEPNRLGGGAPGAGGPELAVGIGLRPGTSADVIVSAVRELLGHRTIRCLATLDRRSGEAGVQGAGAVLGVPVLGFTAAQLTGIEVPHPAVRVAEAVGTTSVAEAAALLASGGGPLVVPKTVVGGVTVAAARELGSGEPTVT